MNLSDYNHSICIPVRYDDLDTFNHVNNKAYLAYLEEARIDLHKKVFKSNGIPDITALVARIEIDYLKPIVYGDTLRLYTRLSEIGTKSFELSTVFTAKSPFNNEFQLAAKAKVVLVNIDLKTGKSIPISELDRQRLMDFKQED
jgi:acyl-CoA thioester hydrolase